MPVSTKSRRDDQKIKCALALRLIERLGGAKHVASDLGKSLSTVHRWTYPKADGGTGGAIPIQLFDGVKKLAHRRQVKLTDDDLLLFRQIRRKRAAK